MSRRALGAPWILLLACTGGGPPATPSAADGGAPPPALDLAPEAPLVAVAVAPDPDRDRDGLPDPRDRCPDEPEDLDGFEDDDGCPDRDNDGDGILDAAAWDPERSTWRNDDQRRIGELVIDCRDRPEDVDGVEDDDGCPEVLPIVDCQIVLPEPVHFKLTKWELRPESYTHLREAAETLRVYPELELEIGGHEDSKGSAKYGRSPTRKRAESVRLFLIHEGVAPERLRAIGYGEEKPIASNHTAEGRAQNRRIELVIVGCAGPRGRAPT
ncbi:MAG: OmpA family protein [Nannocystaceae bacterium]